MALPPLRYCGRQRRLRLRPTSGCCRLPRPAVRNLSEGGRDRVGNRNGDGLADAYERDVLEKLRVEPELKLHDAELLGLENARAELKTKIEKGSERFLTSPDTTKDSLGQSLQRWQEEAKTLDEKIRKLQLPPSDWQGALEAWMKQIGKDLRLLADATEPSTTTVKPVELPPAVLAAARARYQRSVFRCQMIWDDADNVEFEKGPIYEIQPKGPAWLIETTGEFHAGIVTNQALLREFLRKTHAKVTLFWKKRGKRYYRLDTGKLEADFGEHFLGVHNSRGTRARSRDTG